MVSILVLIECCQANALESIILGGTKILGCPSRTCNEAVRGDIGLDKL